MSNQSALGFGFIPRKHSDNRDYDGGSKPYYIPSTDANNYFVGDLVVTVGGSNPLDITSAAGQAPGGAVLMPAGTIPAAGLPTAGTGNLITGAIVRIGYDPSDLSRPIYGKASTNRVVWVTDDQSLIYETRLLGATLLAATGVGDTCSIKISTAGSTVTGRSGQGADSTTLQTSTGSTYQLRIVGVSRDILNNDLSVANPSVYVKINQSSEDNAAVIAIGS